MLPGTIFIQNLSMKKTKTKKTNSIEANII